MPSLPLNRIRHWFETAKNAWTRRWLISPNRRTEWAGQESPITRTIPEIERLEKRLVLNATAELSAFGELFLQGDPGVDTIESNLTATGELQFTDISTGVIPITIGQDAMGNPIRVNSIAIDAITGGRLRINLGQGDDSLNLRLPDGLDADVIGSQGNDTVRVDVLASASTNSRIDVSAENIEINGNESTFFQLHPEPGDAVVTMQRLVTGDVGTVDLGGRPIEIQDRLELLGMQQDFVFESNVRSPSIEITSAGSISQDPDTDVIADSVDIVSDQSVTLNSSTNEIQTARIITSDADVQLTTQTNLNVAQIDAGSANIRLEAISLNDSIDDEVADLIGGSITLQTEGGIGDARVLEWRATELDVTAGTSGLESDVNLKSLAINDPTTVRIDINSGNLGLDQIGGQPMTLQNISVSNGDVRVTGDSVVTIEQIFVRDGSVEVTAGGDLVVVDNDPSDDGVDRNLDPEIIAGGTRGTVRFTSATGVITTNDVQIQAQSIDAGAVTITAPAIELGARFEINTGGGVGIARQFTPRPRLDPEDLIPPNPDLPPLPPAPPVSPGPDEVTQAFYQQDSVRTNILSQFAVNDAEGTLSVNLGTTGENGLTWIIDWGAETNRFQRIENLPGSFQKAVANHVYTQNDLLNSTLNGRGGATDPLNVRFAVEHHESIVLQGQSITQPSVRGDFATENVAGGLISSTDNPATQSAAGPILESGVAFFVIPRVNVPLAFLPIRDVIPDPVDPVPPVFTPTTSTVSGVTLETSEAASSPTSTREEYFRLRALSPDPEAGDLIEPVRLPDNGLESEVLYQLFAELPDGEYEIEYVLGEGEERSILRVDLRDGRPIQLGDDLEAGTLKLTPLDLNELDRTIEGNETGNDPSRSLEENDRDE